MFARRAQHAGSIVGAAGADDSDDRALVARIAGGDRAALELLYRRHAGWVTARLQTRCGDPELTDTAVQDTFLAVWRSARTYRGDGVVAAWLWGIAIRRLIDALRAQSARPRLARSDADRPTHEQVIGGADEFVDAGTSGDLRQALVGLAPDLQAVLVVTAIDGLTTREAGQLLGIPHGTVKTRLMRARAAMQEALT